MSAFVDDFVGSIYNKEDNDNHDTVACFNYVLLSGIEPSVILHSFIYHYLNLWGVWENVMGCFTTFIASQHYTGLFENLQTFSLYFVSFCIVVVATSLTLIRPFSNKI